MVSSQNWRQITISLGVLSKDRAEIRKSWYDRNRSHVITGRSWFGLPWLHMILEWSLQKKIVARFFTSKKRVSIKKSHRAHGERTRSRERRIGKGPIETKAWKSEVQFSQARTVSGLKRRTSNETASNIECKQHFRAGHMEYPKVTGIPYIKVVPMYQVYDEIHILINNDVKYFLRHR